MYCPTCGKDNLLQLKFCASCGTNLETVSQALAPGESDFFTRVNNRLDHFTASYSEHVFKKPPLPADSRPLGRPWQLLMRGVVTTVVDLFLIALIWTLLPFRLIMLLVSTPVRLLAERSERHRPEELPAQSYRPPEMQEPVPQQWLSEPVPSVVENTTTNLGILAGSVKNSGHTTDKLKEIAGGQ